jgi:hypothetical protein
MNSNPHARDRCQKHSDRDDLAMVLTFLVFVAHLFLAYNVLHHDDFLAVLPAYKLLFALIAPPLAYTSALWQSTLGNDLHAINRLFTLGFLTTLCAVVIDVFAFVFAVAAALGRLR